MGSPEIELRRIALTWEQIQQYQPPPNPTKITDSRAEQYMENYGGESWELDALEPAVLEALIEDAVMEIRNDGLFELAEGRQRDNKERLLTLSRNWEDVVQYLGV